MGIDILASRGPDHLMGSARRSGEGEAPGDFDLLLGSLRASDDRSAGRDDAPGAGAEADAAAGDPSDTADASAGDGQPDAEPAPDPAREKQHEAQPGPSAPDRAARPQGDGSAHEGPAAGGDIAAEAGAAAGPADQAAAAAVPPGAGPDGGEPGAMVQAAPADQPVPAAGADPSSVEAASAAQPGAFAAILAGPADRPLPLDPQDLSDALATVVRQTGATLAALPQGAPAGTVQGVVADAAARVAALVARLKGADAGRPVPALAVGGVTGGPSAAGEGFAAAVQTLRGALNLPAPTAQGPVVEVLPSENAVEPRPGQAAAANDLASAGADDADPRTLQAAGGSGQGRAGDPASPGDTFKPVPAAAPRDAALPPPAAEVRAAVAPQTATAPAAARAADTPPSPLPAEAAQQIRKASFSEERTRIELSPRGAGGLEVDLEPAEAGKLRVVIRAENPALLQALRSDRDTLQALLTGSGLSAGDGGLDYESFGDRRRRDLPETAPAGNGAGCGDEDKPIEPARRHIAAGRLDIIT